MKNKKALEFGIGLLVALVTIISLFYTTVFFLGSQEEYSESISKSGLSFILGRIIVNLVASIVLLSAFIFLIYLYNRLTPKAGQYSIKKLAKNYIFFALVLSVILVILVHIIL